jgi:hypothetical protein
MDPEALPWPGRYQGTTVNLRRAYISNYLPAVSTNRATHLLFNASTGDRVLVVRGVNYSGTTAAGLPNLGTLQGTLGALLGSAVPIWRDGPAGAGQHYYVDTLTVLPDQQILSPTTSGNLITTQVLPWAVLPPGWSFYFQGNAAAQTLLLSFYWEELRIDDPILGAIGDRG